MARNPRRSPFRAPTSAAIGITALALALSGCAPSPGGGETAAPADSWEAIVEAAAAEGTLVVYTTSHEGINAAEQAAFNEAYPGISLQYTQLGSGDLTARFSSETEAGSVSADLVKLADNLMLEDRPEWFTALDPDLLPDLGNVPEEKREDWYVPNMSFPYVATINTNLIDDLPTTWEDLADEEFLGKGSISDPRQNATFMSIFAELRTEYGDEYLETLGENYPLFGSLGTVIQEVGAGQVAFSAPGSVGASAAIIEQGAPVTTVILTPQMTGTNLVAVAANARHPNAALVFLNWLLSVEGQAASCLDGQYQSVISQTVSGCPAVPADALLINASTGQEQRAEIVRLLGIE